jgi:agmatine deiminase
MSRSSSSGKTLANAGAALPYRMPAEWEPHDATWLAWPHYHGDWPGKFEPIPWMYCEIIRNLARHERVELIVNDAGAERNIRKLLERANASDLGSGGRMRPRLHSLDNVRFHRWRTDRVWVRDSGCIFVRTSGAKAPGEDSGDIAALEAPRHPKSNSSLKGELSARLKPCPSLLAINFRFNAWAKYSNWKNDDKIGSLMAESKIPTLAAKSAARMGHPAREMVYPYARVKTPTLNSTNDVKFWMGHPRGLSDGEIRPMFGKKRIVLEGGSIDVNGCGTILTTEECLLSRVQQRNPGMSRKDYEKIFADYLGAPHTIWLGKGIIGDDTHGHVDDLTRFVAPDTVVTVVEPNAKDPNHKPLRENLRRLRAASDQDGKPLNVIEIPLPRPVIFEKRRLPASYANFYIANGVVLVPVFNDPNDRIALNTLAELFPTREIVPIYSGDLVWGLGTMHCMTQQQPAILGM